MAQLICLILSVIFAALACSGIPQHPRFHFLSAAVAMLALAFLVGGMPLLR
jgi:hypothetical protein